MAAALWLARVPAASAAGQAGSFLRQDAGARGAALAGALTAIVDDTTALYWNPAGLSRLAKPEASATHVVLFEDTSYDFIAAGLGFGRWGGGAVSYLRQSSGGFERRTLPSDAPTTFAISQSAWLAGWGASLPLPEASWIRTAKPLELGLALKSVRETVDQTAASGTGADVGLILRPQESFALGLRVQNAVAPRLTFVSDPVSYPRLVEVSPAWRLRLDGDWKATAALKIGKLDGESAAASGGVELAYRDLGALRVGYQARGLSAGLGVGFGNVRVDYAAMLADLGVSHLVSFVLRFGHTREELEAIIRRGINELSVADGARLAKLYQRKAEQELADEKLAEALRDLEAASLLDPGNAQIEARLKAASARWDESLKAQMVERTRLLAEQQYQRGNLVASRLYWKSVLEMAPEDKRAAAMVETLDKTLSREERAKLDDLRRAQMGSEIEQSLAAAGSYLQRGLLAQARAEAEKAARRFPDDARIAGFLKETRGKLSAFVSERLAAAENLAQAKDYPGALQAVEAALKQDPENAEAARRAAQLRGLLAQALTPQTRKKVEQLYYRAVEQYLKGRYQEADGLADELLKLDPSSESARALKDKAQAAMRLNP